MRRTALALVLTACTAPSTDAPEPIIDMHLHAGAALALPPMCVPVLEHLPPHDPAIPWADVAFGEVAFGAECDEPVAAAATDEDLLAQTLAIMEQFNVVGVLGGDPEWVAEWKEASPERFVPSLRFQLAEGRFSPDDVREMFATGEMEVFGEISNQYAGIAPDDPRMDPYWSVAEEADVPVQIHLGSGLPGAAYFGYPDMRLADGSPLLLEDVLIAHPRMRLSVMHYGHQRFDDMIALMEHHPQVYVDLGGIQWWYPRDHFYRQLREMVDAGFGKRIMFGSDAMDWPTLIEYSIRVIEEAPFLSESEKRDIFYNNAARFLRLSDEEIARHHGSSP